MLAKFIDGQIKFAGGKIIRNGDEIIVNPREEDFIRVGYKPVVGERLEEKDGYYQVPEYKKKKDKIIVTYRYEEIVDEETIA